MDIDLVLNGEEREICHIITVFSFSASIELLTESKLMIQMD